MTGSEKTAHFALDFKIELLGNPKAIICRIFFVEKVCNTLPSLAISVQSFLFTKIRENVD